MSIEIPEFLEPLLDAGVDVTISKDESLGIYFDLNLEAKSHMYAYKGASGWRVRMRYGVDEPVNSLLDLAYLAASGKHGRDFINPHWTDFIAKHLGEAA